MITGLTAAGGILAANAPVVTATGEGEHITLALSDVGYATVGNLGHIGEAIVNGTERAPIGNDLYGAFGRDFATRDGRRVMVAAITARQWKSLLDAIDGHEAMGHIEAMLGVDLSDEGQRFEARDNHCPGGCALDRRPRLRRGCAPRSTNAAVCWGPYQSFLEMVRDDPRCSTRNPLFEDVDQPGIGRFMMPGSPLEFRHHAREAVRPAPTLGQHTDEILSEVLGLTGRQDRRAPRRRGSWREARRDSGAVSIRARSIDRCDFGAGTTGICLIPALSAASNTHPSPVPRARDSRSNRAPMRVTERG